MPENLPNKPAADSARIKKAQRLNLIWLVPLSAFIVTAFLLWHNTLEQGPKIELTLNSAEGVEPNKTLVKARAVTVGRVIDVKLSNDYQSAIATIQMADDTEDLLRRDTKFWLVKPRVENTGISGLNTLLSGSYFEIQVGHDPSLATEFTALDEPPPLTTSQRGLVIKLKSQARKRLNNGDFVSFRGFTVGRVISSKLNLAQNAIDYEIFIADPYTQLLNQATKFWISSGIDMSLTTEGLKVAADSIDSILRGGVEFSAINQDVQDLPFDAEQEHVLFDNYDSARLNALRSGLLYVVMLKGNLKNIAVGSSVYYQSVKIGEVIEAPWYKDLRSLFNGNDNIPVLIALNFPRSDRGFVASLLHAKLAEDNLCAIPAAGNILTGENRLNLSFTQCSNTLKTYRGLAVIPSQEQPALQDKVEAVLANLQQLDVSGISTELKRALSSTATAMDAFAKSNNRMEQQQLLEKMTKSFESFTAATKAYAEGSALNQALLEAIAQIQALLTEIKPLTTNLGQVPNALLFGSDAQDPEPKAYP